MQTFIADRNGIEWLVVASLKGTPTYQSNPHGLTGEHRDIGSGVVIEDYEMTDIAIRCAGIELKAATIKDIDDRFSDDEIKALDRRGFETLADGGI